MNAFSLPPLISALFLFSLGMVSLLSGWREKLWRLLAIFCFLLMSASLLALWATNAEDASGLAYRVRFAPFFAILSATFAMFYSEILAGRHDKKFTAFFKLRPAGYYILPRLVLMLILLIIIFKTHWLVEQVHPNENQDAIMPYNIKYGPLMYFFAVFIFSAIFKITVTLVKAYRTSTNKPYREFILLNLLAFTLIYQSALTLLLVLPLFGFTTQVFGFLTFPLAVMVFYIAIVRFQIAKVNELNLNLEQKVVARTSDLKEAHLRLAQSEKMASLGLLTAGVAHEINTPIGAMYSTHDTLTKALGKLKDSLESDSDKNICDDKCILASISAISSAAKIIQSGGERVSTIVKRMKTFARLDEAELQKANIEDGIEDTLLMIQHEVLPTVKVEKEFGGIPPFLCYPSQLNQVFLNLFVNALHAMNGKGDLKIRTWVDGKIAFVSISDTGEGISEENLKKIFDPGFTTKGVGVGTGLGLAISYKMIVQHKGHMKVESKVGEGAVFTISIPMDLDEENLS